MMSCIALGMAIDVGRKDFQPSLRDSCNWPVNPAFKRRAILVRPYDERTDLPGLAKLDAGFVRALTSGSSNHVEIYREAMDLSRFDSEDYRNLLRHHLRAKYAGKEIDVVVAVMGPALDFLLSHGDEVFPDTPIVFCGIDRRMFGRRPLRPFPRRPFLCSASAPCHEGG